MMFRFNYYSSYPKDHVYLKSLASYWTIVPYYSLKSNPGGRLMVSNEFLVYRSRSLLIVIPGFSTLCTCPLWLSWYITTLWHSGEIRWHWPEPLGTLQWPAWRMGNLLTGVLAGVWRSVPNINSVFINIDLADSLISQSEYVSFFVKSYMKVAKPSDRRSWRALFNRNPYGLFFLEILTLIIVKGSTLTEFTAVSEEIIITTILLTSSPTQWVAAIIFCHAS